MGKGFIVAGLVLLAVGLVLTHAPGLFSWFGRLPGDIRIEGEGRYLFIPITSMLVISVVLSLIINLWLRR